MAKQQKCPPCPKGLPGWLQTFGDLMSLLLCFFVLLLSFSTMKKEDFEKAVGSLQGALGVLPGEPILSSPIKLELPIVRGDLTEARPTLKEAKSELEKQVEAEGQQQNVEIIESEDEALLKLKKQQVKYVLTDQGAELRNKTVTLYLRYDHMPLTGRLYEGFKVGDSFKLPGQYKLK